MSKAFKRYMKWVETKNSRVPPKSFWKIFSPINLIRLIGEIAIISLVISFVVAVLAIILLC